MSSMFTARNIVSLLYGLLSNYQYVSWRNSGTADLLNLSVRKPAAYKDKRGGYVVKIKCA